MSHATPSAVRRATARAVLALAVTLLSLGSPWVAISAASNAGGAEKPRPATFGDCKNDNSGLHYGYYCYSVPVLY